MFNCIICKNIKNYEVMLTSLNVKNNLEALPKDLTIGVKVEFLKSELEEKKIKVPVNIDLLGLRKKLKDSSVDEDDDNVLFKMNLVYQAILYLNENIDNSKVSKEELEEYVYFLLEPTLNEAISSIGNKIGVPSLKLPKRIK